MTVGILKTSLLTLFFGLFLSFGCVATPLPTPPSIDESKLTLVVHEDGIVLSGLDGALNPGSSRLLGLRITGERAWAMAAIDSNSTFSVSLPGAITETYYIEGMTEDNDLFLVAVVADDSSDGVRRIDPGPDRDGDGCPDVIDCNADDPNLSGQRCGNVGTLYYISNDGNDEADGRSPGSAWQTLEHVNAQTLSPGDFVLFQKGGLWRGDTLVVSQSGTSENFITISSFGSGSRPKFFGSERVTTFSSHTRANVYIADQAIPINPWNVDTENSDHHGAIFFEENERVQWGDHYIEAGIDNLAENYDWFWQDGTIYFYFDGDISEMNGLECVQIRDAIQINGEYVAIDGFDIRYFANQGIGTNLYPEATTRGAHIRNCHIAFTGTRAGLVGFGIRLHFSDMIIENNEIHDNGSKNIALDILNSEVNPGVTIENVIVQDNELYGGWFTTGVHLEILGNQHTVRDITIRRNYIWEEPNNDKSDYFLIMTFVENNGDIGDLQSVYFYNNIVRNTQRVGLQLHGVTDAFVVNNTFSGTFFSDDRFYAFIYHDMVGNSTILNNIFYNYTTKASTTTYISVRGTTGGTETTFDELNYNLYYTVDDGNYLLAEVPNGPFRQSQWAELQAEGYEINSLTPPQDPMFNDPLYDLRPVFESPAVGSGVPVSFVTTDIVGNPRDPVNPDIGAYEF